MQQYIQANQPQSPVQFFVDPSHSHIYVVEQNGQGSAALPPNLILIRPKVKRHQLISRRSQHSASPSLSGSGMISKSQLYRNLLHLHFRNELIHQRSHEKGREQIHAKNR
jgi:hypothetical protein